MKQYNYELVGLAAGNIAWTVKGTVETGDSPSDFPLAPHYALRHAFAQVADDLARGNVVGYPRGPYIITKLTVELVDASL